MSLGDNFHREILNLLLNRFFCNLLHRRRRRPRLHSLRRCHPLPIHLLRNPHRNRLRLIPPHPPRRLPQNYRPKLFREQHLRRHCYLSRYLPYL